ncbi:CubicO group peptidase (beta-lactamase class C family) [Crossiella equi]|uniref:CubicO group peptidase (Beta-lactamase class C family) n=1 Tax=Crossiella equi TaxID=130796 RepID=A0ABS5A8R0_9PSEU|nr:serine hydrolase domain-containing protein [Crossiella equi]MBP2472677.1 CubicO group peptidase (beta-lactamase class C family) [Crossiella equi]
MSSSELLPPTQRALLRRVAVEQSGSRLPSLTVGLVRGGALVWQGARGQVEGAPVTPDTQYRIGSITKTFVALLVMRLRDEGKLDLSDQLDRHVPGSAAGERTIAQLLSHTSGITAESHGQWWERTPGYSAQELLDGLTPEDLRHRASRRFHYSNVGYGLLGELVARLRGHSWEDALRAEVLEPLGMQRTTTMPKPPHAHGWAVHPWADVLLPEPAHDAVAMAPAGQLWSTIPDLSQLAKVLLGDSGEVLHPDTVAEMREPATVDDGDEWRAGYGLGLQLVRHKGRRLAGHTGSMPGFVSTVWTDAKEETGVIYLTNSTVGPSGPVATDLLDLLHELEPHIPAEWTPLSGTAPELLALTGQWYWGPSPYALRLLPDGLLDLQPWAGRGRASRFRPNSDGTWTGLDGYYAGELLRVGRDANGVATHLDLNTFIFTRTPYDPAAPIPGGVNPDGWVPVADA